MRPAVPLALLALAGCTPTATFYEPRRGTDLLRLFEGRWDEEDRPGRCRAAVHTLALSPDRAWLVRTDSSAAGATTARFRVLSTSRHHVRLHPEGDATRAPDGRAVLLDLVLLERGDTYCLRRSTDPSDRCSVPQRRCR